MLHKCDQRVTKMPKYNEYKRFTYFILPCQSIIYVSKEIQFKLSRCLKCRSNTVCTHAIMCEIPLLPLPHSESMIIKGYILFKVGTYFVKLKKLLLLLMNQ